MREEHEFQSSRMLIVGGRPHALQVMRQLFDILGVRRVQAAARLTTAVELLRTQSFAAVYCDEHLTDTDPETFAHAARRSAGLHNPLVPIFLVTSAPRRRDVEAARDLGFSDVLARPLSAATVLRKLKIAVERPRPFIVTGEFFGPDRRSAARRWPGDERRKRQPRRVKVDKPIEPADA